MLRASIRTRYPPTIILQKQHHRTYLNPHVSGPPTRLRNLVQYFYILQRLYMVSTTETKQLREIFTVFGLSGNGHVDGGRLTWKFPFALNFVSKSLVPKILTLVTVSFFFSQNFVFKICSCVLSSLIFFLLENFHMCFSVMEINGIQIA